MIDKKGFRTGIGIILANDSNRLLFARRIGQNGWQFPQGGVNRAESPEEAMFRELYEEVGLQSEDVEILAASKDWFKYRLPKYMVRRCAKPICLGQRQRWFLLRLLGDDQKVRFDVTNKPEFDGFKWVRYWYPLRQVISFKKNVYRQVLQEFATVLFGVKS
ncbi:MAG: RNA pyrophosphohydrolase [Gammaproteobacteria bacterium]|jgi:putative (di)nucleoside polyphosphate hydrolase